MSDVIYRQITAADEAAVIDLANEVHGDNYLTPESFQHYLSAGTAGNVQLNWLAIKDGEMLGVRLTLAPGEWPIDSFCTPSEWPFPADKLCYFKCAAVSEKARGLGIGKTLLQRSIDSAKELGCQGGLAHIWMQSPQNSAYEYFTRCGGEMIKQHGKRWYQASVEDGYYCPVCDGTCYCDAGEMLLKFDN
jgi:ribosomal protein S18 acetylase RimI-like enzyme